MKEGRGVHISEDLRKQTRRLIAAVVFVLKIYNNLDLQLRKVDLSVCSHHLCRGWFDDIMKSDNCICPECPKPFVSVVDLSVSNVIEEGVYY